MPTTPAPTSSASVTTERAARYAKQLAAHLGRRVVTEWDERSGTGHALVDGGRCDLTATPHHLLLDVSTDPSVDADRAAEHLTLIEDVVGRHLVRFGARDELVVRWVRSDGSVGREYASTDDRPEGHTPGE